MFVNLPPLNANTLLKEHGLRADKGLGQNFLHDTAALEKIVLAAELQSTDVVLEIGPGLGSLTRYMALAAASVTTVEIDPDLIPILRTVLASFPNVRIITGDILKLSPPALVQSNDYLVVANVPYYITSAIFRHLLESSPRPRRMVLTIQKEVAERICAMPGEMSLLSLSVQIYGHPRIAAILPAETFFPAPKVDSAVIRVDMYPQPRIPQELINTFFLITKAGFSQKRKTLRNSLSAGLRFSSARTVQWLEEAGIDPMRRPETLSIEEWSALCAHYKPSA